MNPPPKLLRKVVDFIDRFAVMGHSEAVRLKQELGRYLRAPRKALKGQLTLAQERRIKSVQHAQSTTEIRAAVMGRANGFCELHPAHAPLLMKPPWRGVEMHHLESGHGRRRRPGRL